MSMSWSLPQDRSVVAISYGCIGRCASADSTASASTLPTLRFFATAVPHLNSYTITCSRAYAGEYRFGTRRRPRMEDWCAARDGPARKSRNDVALRWYSLVVDCQNVRKQAYWWAEVL